MVLIRMLHAYIQQIGCVSMDLYSLTQVNKTRVSAINHARTWGIFISVMTGCYKSGTASLACKK
jgi:hypothetical protein